MIDRVPVELIGLEHILPASDPDAGARDRGENQALGAAVRTVTDHRLVRKICVHLHSHLAAMAA